jgi:hypothetical protein
VFELEREVLVVWDVSDRVDVRDEVVLFNIDREDLTSSIDHNHTISIGIPCGDEA